MISNTVMDYTDRPSNIEKIENFDKAFEDIKTWVCHHRLEKMPWSGKEVNPEYLINQGLYFHQPPEALIFVTKKEHQNIHLGAKNEKWWEDFHNKSVEARKNNGTYKHTEEWKNNHSNKMNGHKGYAKGKHIHLNVSEAYKKDNMGLNWNEFQKYYSKLMQEEK